MFKSITRYGLLPILSIAFKLFLLIFTGINSYQLLYGISQDPIWSLVGVALFEGALLFWWTMFRNDTEPSIAQIAISLAMFIISLLLVLAASALHLQAISATALGAHTVSRVVIAAVAFNLAAVLVHSILSPDTANEVIKRTVAGIVWAKAHGGLFSQTDQLAANLTVELTDQTWNHIEADVRRQANRSLGNRPALPAPTMVPAAEEMTEEHPEPVAHPNGRPS